MELYGLIGHPLEHSFSQQFFTEIFHKEGLDHHYENFDLSDLEQCLELFESHNNLKGLNVTAPYKETILHYLDGYDAVVEEIKSVNTIKIIPNGSRIGFNTDIVGFTTILEERRLLPEISNQSSISLKALVLGTGGASKAVQYVLRHQGIPYRTVSRDPMRGDLTYQDLHPETIQQHLLIVNTTPLGTAPDTEAAPNIPYEAIGPSHWLIDLIYNPVETLFLRRGRENGAHTTNGLSMLHAQAEASWQLWQTPLEKLNRQIIFKVSSR